MIGMIKTAARTIFSSDYIVVTIIIVCSFIYAALRRVDNKFIYIEILFFGCILYMLVYVSVKIFHKNK